MFVDTRWALRRGSAGDSARPTASKLVIDCVTPVFFEDEVRGGQTLDGIPLPVQHHGVHVDHLDLSRKGAGRSLGSRRRGHAPSEAEAQEDGKGRAHRQCSFLTYHKKERGAGIAPAPRSADRPGPGGL